MNPTSSHFLRSAVPVPSPGWVKLFASLPFHSAALGGELDLGGARNARWMLTPWRYFFININRSIFDPPVSTNVDKSKVAKVAGICPNKCQLTEVGAETKQKLGAELRPAWNFADLQISPDFQHNQCSQLYGIPWCGIHHLISPTGNLT